MKLSNLTETVGMTNQLARETGLTQPNISYRAKQGWCIGKLDGKIVMYNPKHITELGPHHIETLENWEKENAEI